jgi:hypothetical protein
VRVDPRPVAGVRLHTYQHNEAITIMDAWWPMLLEAEFRPVLGSEAFGAAQSMLRFGAPYSGSAPEAPEFRDGWYGDVRKDLRDLLAANGSTSRPLGAYSRIYCGNGSLEACCKALQGSLQEALSTTPAQLYGHGACAKTPQAGCFDMNRWTSASGITVPPFPFQNRPPSSRWSRSRNPHHTHNADGKTGYVSDRTGRHDGARPASIPSACRGGSLEIDGASALVRSSRSGGRSPK